MKQILLFCLFLLTAGPAVLAQINPVPAGCGISFDYDNAGNRIKRYVCVDNIELQFRETTEDGQLTQKLDLEGMLSDAGFSEELEAEIEQLEALLSNPSTLDPQSEKSADQPKLELTKQNFGDLSDMLVFPNPTTVSFSVKGKDLHPAATLSLVDMTGRILLQRLPGRRNRYRCVPAAGGRLPGQPGLRKRPPPGNADQVRKTLSLFALQSNLMSMLNVTKRTKRLVSYPLLFRNPAIILSPVHSVVRIE